MRIGNCSVLIPEGRERGTGHVGLLHAAVYTIRLGNHYHDRDLDAEVSVDGKPVGLFRVCRSDNLTLERGISDNGRFTFLRAGTEDAADAGEAEIAAVDRGLVQVRFLVGQRSAAAQPVSVPQPYPVPVPVPYPVPYPVPRPRPWWPSYPYPRPPTWTITSATTADTPSAVHSHSTSIMRGSSVGSPPSVSPAGSSAQCDSELRTDGITGLTGSSDQAFVDAAFITHDPAEETIITLRLVCDERPAKRVRKLEPAARREARRNDVPAPAE